MGVRGLQTYLERYCPSACPHVRIPDLVLMHRKIYPTEELVIVVDGSSCIHHLYDLDWIGGGQLVQFVEKVKSFVQAFADQGITLVFFFDGPTFEGKRRTWVERKYDDMRCKYNVLDEISSGTPTDCIPREHLHLPPSLGYTARVIIDTVCGCKVYQSIGEDCDKEIAEYAKTHQVFGILAQDTDYVIFDCGEALYFSMKHLNLKTMSTCLYDRKELSSLLGIKPSQLPLFATLLGNDILSAQQMKPYHHRITGHHNLARNISYTILFPSVAKYVSTLSSDQDELRSQLPVLAKTILGSAARASDIMASLESFEITSQKGNESEDIGICSDNDHWSQIMTEALRRHKNNYNPSSIFSVMSGLPFESSTSLEDFRLNDLPAFAKLTQPIRERMYGILLQEKPLPESGVHLVPEWCMTGPGSLDEAKHVPSVPPTTPHPGLLTLWNEDTSLMSIRWALFVSSVSAKLNISRVMTTLPPYLVVPTLVLFHINELGCLDPWEVDATLATASCIKYYDVARLAALASDPVSVRSVRVANLIMRCTYIIYMLLASCGYPLTLEKTAPWLFFDGKLFQKKYNEAESGCCHSQLCDDRADVLQDFKAARSVVFDNTYN